MYANRGGSGASDGFVADFADLARALRASGSVPDLSPREEHQLKDIADNRYQWIVLRSLINICSRSTRPEHREAMAEIIRSECLRYAAPASSITSAFDEETRAVADAEMPQREFERAPCPSTLRVLREKFTRQLSATRRALDAIHLHRPATPHWSKLPEKGAP